MAIFRCRRGKERRRGKPEIVKVWGRRRLKQLFSCSYVFCDGSDLNNYVAPSPPHTFFFSLPSSNNKTKFSIGLCDGSKRYERCWLNWLLVASSHKRELFVRIADGAGASKYQNFPARTSSNNILFIDFTIPLFLFVQISRLSLLLLVLLQMNKNLNGSIL